MNLIIDAGNTQIKWGIFKSDAIVDQGTVDEWSDLMTHRWVDRLADTAHCIFSSTRKISPDFVQLIKQKADLVFELNHQLPLPFKIDYSTPDTLGLDRVAALAGAEYLFPAENVLIIDLGTAITFDVLEANGTFVGGNISPGMNIRFQSLHRFTDNLPLVHPDANVNEIAGSTAEAIQAGVQSGILFEVIAYINSLKNKYNELRVILTGGDAGFFVKKLKKTIFVDPNLVLKGLNHILEFQLTVQDGTKN